MSTPITPAWANPSPAGLSGMAVSSEPMSATNIAPDSPEAGKAIDLLVKDHLNSPDLPPLSFMLASRGAPAAEKLCRVILDKSKDKKAQAFACLGLAQVARKKAEDNA